MGKLSACLIVKDEEACLSRCLESIKSVVDEIIIVDTGSTDRTVEIAKSFTSKVFRVQWRDSFAVARNESLKHANGDWILIIDADEYLEDGADHTIREAMKLKHDFIPLYQFRILNHTEDGILQHFTARLFPSCFKFSGSIHEQLEHIEDKPFTPVRLHGPGIIHTGYSHAIMEAKDKLNRNKRILERTPSDLPHVCYNLGNTYIMMKEYDLALENYLKVLKHPGKTYTLHAFCCALKILIAEGRPKEAFDLCKEAPEDKETSPDYWCQCGFMLIMLQRYEDAIESFRKAIALKDDPEIYYIHDQSAMGWRPLMGIALSFNGLGEKKLHKEYLVRAHELAPDNQKAAIQALIDPQSTIP